MWISFSVVARPTRRVIEGKWGNRSSGVCLLRHPLERIAQVAPAATNSRRGALLIRRYFREGASQYAATNGVNLIWHIRGETHAHLPKSVKNRLLLIIDCAASEIRPCVHHLAAHLNEFRAPVGLLSLAADGMCQCYFP